MVSRCKAESSEIYENSMATDDLEKIEVNQNKEEMENNEAVSIIINKLFHEFQIYVVRNHIY